MMLIATICAYLAMALLLIVPILNLMMTSVRNHTLQVYLQYKLQDLG